MKPAHLPCPICKASWGFHDDECRDYSHIDPKLVSQSKSALRKERNEEKANTYDAETTYNVIARLRGKQQ